MCHILASNKSRFFGQEHKMRKYESDDQRKGNRVY